MTFEPTRAAGLERLRQFVPCAADDYRRGRNYDLSAGKASVVSQLSPWLRHRLIAEWEVLAAVTQSHTASDAMPYIQEVFWRGYFKGWLEQHPSVWPHYMQRVDQYRRIAPSGYSAAVKGQTGIACFDHWCGELRETGYLHNHARMWFASIWIFTLRLPWELGAAFFLDHLSDGDPASNTLSWRWVAGLHTKGKHYLATADNIARFTDGQFNPQGQLASEAAPLVESAQHPLAPLPSFAAPSQGTLRLVTEEDCFAMDVDVKSQAGVLGIISPDASCFAKHAVSNTCETLGGEVYEGHDWSTAIANAAHKAGTREVTTPYIATGFVQDGMRKAQSKLARHGISLLQTLRPYDANVWPHASKGFFKLKKQIPQLLAHLPT